MNVPKLAAYVLSVTQKQVSAVVNRVTKVINVTNVQMVIMGIQNADAVVVIQLEQTVATVISLAFANAIKRATVHVR